MKTATRTRRLAPATKNTDPTRKSRSPQKRTHRRNEYDLCKLPRQKTVTMGFSIHGRSRQEGGVF